MNNFYVYVYIDPRNLEEFYFGSRCPEGHVERAYLNSCHQRYCPQCQALATERWLDAQKARLLACAQAPVETPALLTPEAFLARFANARSSTHCPRCGRALIVLPLPRHATGPPPLLH